MDTLEALLYVYKNREDLRIAFPEVVEGDICRLMDWAVTYGLEGDGAQVVLEPFRQDIYKKRGQKSFLFLSRHRILAKHRLDQARKHKVRLFTKSVDTRGEYRSRFMRLYGDDFVFEIDGLDEMYLFLVEHSISDPIQEYFESGESMMLSLEEIFDDLKINRIDSFLDFACGYGRFLRFLVQRMDSSCITVADINRRAVDFCKRTFGVRGFYSTASPNSLTDGEKYSVIFVASLFSHLPSRYWDAWLKKLSSMLAPGGVLIFSTHGMSCLESTDPSTRAKVKEVMDGFYYLSLNETLDLSTDQYGTTYVTPEFVRDFVDANGLGELRAYYPKKLWHFQDVYVIGG